MPLRCLCVLCSCLFLLGCEKNAYRFSPLRTIPYPAETELPVYRGYDTLVQGWKSVYENDQPEIKMGTVQFWNRAQGYMVSDTWEQQGSYSMSSDGGLHWSIFKLLPPQTNAFKIVPPFWGIAYWNNAKVPFESKSVPIYGLREVYEYTWDKIYTPDASMQNDLANLQVFHDTLAYGITRGGKLIRIFHPGLQVIREVRSSGDVKVDQVSNFYFSDPKHGWLVAARGMHPDSTPAGMTIKHTADHGLNWQTQFSDDKTDAGDVFALDSNHAWITGSSGIYRTADAGAHWNYVGIKKSDGSKVAPQKIVFTDALNGYLISTNEVLRTTDGGLTWNRSLKCGFEDFKDLSLTGTEILWALTDSYLYNLSL